MQLSVIGDDLNVSQIEPGETRQTRKTVKCLVHPRFTATNYFVNDIAMVFVDRPFIETDTFGPTKIKIHDALNAEPIENEPCRMGKL